MKHLYILFAILGSVGFLSAQTEGVFKHYTVQPYLINPALAGFDDIHQIRLNYRSAWTGFPDAPNIYGVNYNGPVGKTFGLGGQLQAEQIARSFRYHLKGSYAFQTTVKEFDLAAGFSTTFINSRLKSSLLKGYGIDETDPEVIDAQSATSRFEAALGLYVRYNKQTFVGLTFPSLISSRLDEVESQDAKRSGGEYFLLHIGQELRFRERNFKITPSIMLGRVYGAPFRVDFNTIASFMDEQLIAGLTYTAGAGSDVALMLGTKLDRLRIFYSYDINFGKFQAYSNGSHEVTLGFDFNSHVKTIDAARYN